MSWLDWCHTAAGAASLTGLSLAGVLGLVSWQLTRATDALIRQGHTDAQALLAQTTADTHAILARMDERTTRMHELAEARHREAIQAIQARRAHAARRPR